jgi:hypothetical protein
MLTTTRTAGLYWWVTLPSFLLYILISALPLIELPERFRFRSIKEIFLSEILRQAEDSGIFSMQAVSGRIFPIHYSRTAPIILDGFDDIERVMADLLEKITESYDRDGGTILLPVQTKGKPVQ